MLFSCEWDGTTVMWTDLIMNWNYEELFFFILLIIKIFFQAIAQRPVKLTVTDGIVKGIKNTQLKGLQMCVCVCVFFFLLFFMFDFIRKPKS